jgi:hypothetical protein
VAADAVTERGRERLLAAIEAWTQRAQEAGHPRAADQDDALTHLATLVLTRPVSITEAVDITWQGLQADDAFDAALAGM